MSKYSVKNVGRKAPKFNGVVPYTSVDVEGMTLKEVLDGLMDGIACINLIAVSAITGGTVSVSTGVGYKGQTVRLSASPSEGYAFTSWSVKKTDGADVPVSGNTFVMPDQSVTVSATFTAIPQPEAES